MYCLDTYRLVIYVIIPYTGAIYLLKYARRISPIIIVNGIIHNCVCIKNTIAIILNIV